MADKTREAGKGDSLRPRQVPLKVWEENYERTFSKTKKEEEFYQERDLGDETQETGSI
jgi:hypothetical protein